MRSDKRSLRQVLSAIHGQRDEHTLAQAWRNGVMAEIARTGRYDATTSEIERLAPRFALAGLTLVVFALTTASYTLNALPRELYSVYANHALSIDPYFMNM